MVLYSHAMEFSKTIGQNVWNIPYTYRYVLWTLLKKPLHTIYIQIHQRDKLCKIQYRHKIELNILWIFFKLNSSVKFNCIQTIFLWKTHIQFYMIQPKPNVYKNNPIKNSFFSVVESVIILCLFNIFFVFFCFYP